MADESLSFDRLRMTPVVLGIFIIEILCEWGKILRVLILPGLSFAKQNRAAF
ncbi:MAG: hypothetical protein JW918_08655 [Anaerolineae bacterium]|nr:hypothetical protein [Anaerolineae bacterium]